jgi:hypothetical protein
MANAPMITRQVEARGRRFSRQVVGDSRFHRRQKMGPDTISVKGIRPLCSSELIGAGGADIRV